MIKISKKKLYLFLTVIVGIISFLAIKYTMAITNNNLLYTRDEASDEINRLKSEVSELQEKNAELDNKGDYISVGVLKANTTYAANTRNQVTGLKMVQNLNEDLYGFQDDKIILKKAGNYKVTTICSITNTPAAETFPVLFLELNDIPWISYFVPVNKYGHYHPTPSYSRFAANTALTVYVQTYDASITYSQYTIIVEFIE